MWKKIRVLFLAMVQSDVHQCTRRLVLPLGVTSESPARVAACIALLIKLVCESVTHCTLSLSTLCGSRGGILLSSCPRLFMYMDKSTLVSRMLAVSYGYIESHLHQ